MVRIALIGLGKMGLSHLAILRSHPDVELVAVCDTSGYVLDALTKYAGITTHSDYRQMLAKERLDGVVIATPSRFHPEMVRHSLDLNLHVFCEKPFCLDPEEGRRLADLARQRGVVNQVGYHNRFVSVFGEAKRLIDTGVLGRIHHIRAEAYGAVVVKPKNSTWRSRASEGGGCLYDYASHAIDLIIFMTGRKPERVGGSVLASIFSKDVDDEVYSTMFFDDGLTGQLSANWSDPSHRKMSTKVSVWGTSGRLTVDRQELHVFVRDRAVEGPGFKQGWTSRNTTEFASEQFFYLRGEEYSAQIDHFISAIRDGTANDFCSFDTAVMTDEITALIKQNANGESNSTPKINLPKNQIGDLLNRAKNLVS